MGKRGRCVVCGAKFELKKKGFKRFSLKAQLGPNFDVDVLTALSKIRPDIAASKYPDDGHVCDSCFRLLRSTLRQREQIVKTEIEWENRFVNGPYGKQILKTKKLQLKKRAAGSRGTRKRKLGEVQNILDEKDRKSKRLKLEPTISILCKNGGHKNYMKLVIAYLLQYRYHRAFTTLVAGSKRAKEAFLGVLENQVRKEVFYYCKTAETCSEETSVESFSWNRECKKMESKMPTFYSACYAAMDTRKGTDLVHSVNVSRTALVRPRLGLMMTLPLYTRRGRKFGFLPHTLSLLLHHYGNSDKVMKILHHLGVCRPSTPALMTKVEEFKKDEAERLLFLATRNLGENLPQSTMMGRSTTKMPSRRGKLPTASLPPADGNASDESDDDQSSDDENAPVDNDDNNDMEGEESDDSSFMNMLSSDEDDEEETYDEEEDDEKEWMEVGEDEMVVEGCVEDIEGQEVELVLMESYKALKEGT